MYSATLCMDFYFNTSIDYTYAWKYYTSMCFHLFANVIIIDPTRTYLVSHVSFQRVTMMVVVLKKDFTTIGIWWMCFFPSS
jgi:hypothetical protein